MIIQHYASGFCIRQTGPDAFQTSLHGKQISVETTLKTARLLARRHH